MEISPKYISSRLCMGDHDSKVQVNCSIGKYYLEYIDAISAILGSTRTQIINCLISQALLNFQDSYELEIENLAKILQIDRSKASQILDDNIDVFYHQLRLKDSSFDTVDYSNDSSEYLAYKLFSKLDGFSGVSSFEFCDEDFVRVDFDEYYQYYKCNLGQLQLCSHKEKMLIDQYLKNGEK